MFKVTSVIAGTWRYFTSMSLGLVLLCLIIVFSVVGTFNTEIFSSHWFLALSGLLTLNLLACTARRVTGLLRTGTGIPAVLSNDGQHRVIKLANCQVTKATKEAGEELRLLGLRVHVQEFKEGHLITGRKNNWGNLASPVLHLAMVLVIVGSVVGGLWGHSQYYQVEVPGKANLIRDGFPFDLKVKKFSIETYTDGTPRQYTSILEVLSANETKLEKTVSVNHPLNHQGVKVYQTAYGYHLQGAVRDNRHSFDFKLEEGGRLFLGGPAYLELEIHWPRYFVFSKGMPFSMGVAELSEPVKLLDKEIVFTGRTPFTGLEVKTDPGLPFVWAGFVLFLIALPLRLYVRPNQIWLLLSERDTGTEVRLAAQHRIRGQEQEEKLMQKLIGITREECSLNT